MVPIGGIENSCPVLSVPNCQPWVAQRGKTLPKNQKGKTKTDVLFLHLPEGGNSGIVEAWNLVWMKSGTNG